MRAVDRAMIDDYGISLLQMMEHAGLNLARLSQGLFLNVSGEKPILILAGRGGNGGGALVCARHLQNWGYNVRVILSGPVRLLQDVPRHQLNILHKLAVSVEEYSNWDRSEAGGLMIDGIIGYSLAGKPAGVAAEMIEWVNRQDCPVLSLDIPSGLDATKGFIAEPVINATATMTLALPKTGLAEKSAREYVGDLYLADIGVPAQLYARPPFKLNVGPLFAEQSIVRIDL